MRRAASLLATALLAGAAAASADSGERRAVVSPEFTAVLAQGSISVEARPLEGETFEGFVNRLARDKEAAGKLGTRQPVTLPYAALSDEARKAAITALFPSDVRATIGWLHVAVGSENLAAIADWFTGRPNLAPTLAKLNGLQALGVSRGSTVTIPVEYLLPPFRDAEALADELPAGLEFDEDEEGRYARYRLRKKEALYSSVVVRFTGRVHAEDVVQLALRIALRSGIDDVHAIPVGFPVKIPLEYLTEDFLPADDPRAQEYRREKAEASQFAVPLRAEGLAGVRVIVDAGHGGRDTGTLHAGVWESTYVYDVACRLRKVLAERTKAEVVMITKEPALGFSVPRRDVLEHRKGHVLLTTPPYPLYDPVVGVNLRWYLANSLLKKPGPDRKKVSPEKTVFLSIHADSLHSSVRGAMVYVPGERFLRDRFGKRGTAYASYKEFRDEPLVSFNKKERVESEGVSTALAEKLVGAFKASGLPVHPFKPVRTHVIRNGREWVPAVLRYNRVPTRVLVEMSNLGNEEDRALTTTQAFRQKVAEALAAGLVEFFSQGAPAPELVRKDKDTAVVKKRVS